MKLYLCKFCMDYTPYMGREQRGEPDMRLVWAHDEDEAQVKLERALGTDRAEPGGDSKNLRYFEIHQAIE